MMRSLAQNTAKSTLPSFIILSGASFVCLAVAACIVWVFASLNGALSIFAGYIVGVAVFGSIYLFVGHALDPFLPAVRGKAKPQSGAVTAIFALILPLKYIILGFLMWLLWKSDHLNPLWLLLGFLLTQVIITAITIRSMVRQPGR